MSVITKLSNKVRERKRKRQKEKKVYVYTVYIYVYIYKKRRQRGGQVKISNGRKNNNVKQQKE